MFKLKISLDRHNARLKLNCWLLSEPPHFSLPSTLKGSTRRETTSNKGIQQDGDCWVVVSDHDDWTQQCTLYSIIFLQVFFPYLTTVLAKNLSFISNPFCLANSPFRVPGQGSNPWQFGRQAWYQPTNDDLCFGFFLMFLCLICKEAGASNLWHLWQSIFFVSLFSCLAQRDTKSMLFFFVTYGTLSKHWTSFYLVCDVFQRCTLG
jgi:hypothetical protein